MSTQLVVPCNQDDIDRLHQRFEKEKAVWGHRVKIEFEGFCRMLIRGALAEWDKSDEKYEAKRPQEEAAIAAMMKEYDEAASKIERKP